MVSVGGRIRRWAGVVGVGLILLSGDNGSPILGPGGAWQRDAAMSVLARSEPGTGVGQKGARSLDESAEADVSLPEGLAGAAAALAVRDFARALQLTQPPTEDPRLEVPPEDQSESWVWVGVLRGRALRGLGRSEHAVAELTPRWASKVSSRFFPLDVLGMELARAKLDWAESLEPAAADAERKEASRILDRVQRLDDVRNLAEMRVLQAEAALAMQGTSPAKSASLARSAVRAVGNVLADYPNHPRYGELWLAKARAMVRAGQVVEAAETFRSIFIQRAGEPEADLAWADLEALAQVQSRVKWRPLSTPESIDRAVAARNLRWVELSRQILDTVIDDPKTPGYLRDDARSQRTWTAYKQRDFAQCANDMRPIYARSPTSEHRDRLLRCLERGEMYEEALEIWAAQAKTKRKAARLTAAWEAVQLAYRAGRYEEALKWLQTYEKDTKGRGQERAWLHAWLPMRLGRVDEAIEGFERAERYAVDRTRARYFRGKLLLGHPEDGKKNEGATLLAALVQNDPYGYYGLASWQRLRDANRDAPEIPPIEPMRDEGVHPTRLDTQSAFDDLDEQFGDGWPAIRRARQLYGAGYLEEARREVRIAVESFLLRGGRTGGVHNESYIVGLGWKSSWTHPTFKLSKSAKADLRQRDSSEALRIGLRELSRGLDEPHRYIRLSTPEDGHWKARWQPRAFRWALEREARLQEIDPVHLWSLMYTESRFRRFVVSPVGARGALQIMPWTGRQLAERLGEFKGSFDADSLFDIDTNAHLSAYYVAELLRKFHGQAPMAYASYNGGPSNVARWLKAKHGSPAPLQMDVFIEEMVFTESYRYAKRVMEVSAVYALLYGGGVPRWDNTVDPNFESNIDF